jgi:hypothetical protein
VRAERDRERERETLVHFLEREREKPGIGATMRERGAALGLETLE